jgi:anti-sigma factor RsiW
VSDDYRPTKDCSHEDRAAHGGLTCWEFDNFILDYLDGALDAETRTMFDGHLATCPPCRAYFESYGATLTAAKRALGDKDEAAPAEAPPALIAAILRAVRER